MSTPSQVWGDKTSQISILNFFLKRKYVIIFLLICFLNCIQFTCINFQIRKKYKNPDVKKGINYIAVIIFWVSLKHIAPHNL